MTSGKPKQKQDIDERIETQCGIYRDEDGAIYEGLMIAESAEDSELLVVYRELFGDYKAWSVQPKIFQGPPSLIERSWYT